MASIGHNLTNGIPTGGQSARHLDRQNELELSREEGILTSEPMRIQSHNFANESGLSRSSALSYGNALPRQTQFTQFASTGNLPSGVIPRSSSAVQQIPRMLNTVTSTGSSGSIPSVIHPHLYDTAPSVSGTSITGRRSSASTAGFQPLLYPPVAYFQQNGGTLDRSGQCDMGGNRFKGKATNSLLRKLSYDGKGSWETFIKQFDTMSHFCGLTEREKLHHLFVSLSADAADYVFSLENEILEDYCAVRHYMAQRFQTKRTRDNWQNEFYQRELKKGENITAYASDLKQLLHKAYPIGLTPTITDDLLLKQFFDGIKDERVRYHVKYLQQPKNMDQAVEKLQEYLSFEGHYINTSKVWKVMDYDESCDDEIQVDTIQERKTELASMRNDLQQLSEMVHHLIGEVRADKRKTERFPEPISIKQRKEGPSIHDYSCTKPPLHRNKIRKVFCEDLEAEDDHQQLN